MLAINDGTIYNNGDPWSQNIVKDSKTGTHYEILWDGTAIYLTETVSPVVLLDMIDDVTGIYHQIFIYNLLAYTLPVKDELNNPYYSDNCFISAGSTVVINIVKTTTGVYNINDLEVNVMDKVDNTYLYLDVTLTELKVNMFKIMFVMPLKGEYLVTIKTLNEFLSEPLFVNEFTHTNLINKVERISDDDIGYI